MRIARVALAFLIAVTACTSPVKKTGPDAATASASDGPQGDARPSDGSQAASDAAAGTTCTGKLYDTCNPASSNCMSGDCHLFSTRGFAVCTQACSSTNPCPSQNGTAVSCNNMGICVPSAPNPGCT